MFKNFRSLQEDPNTPQIKYNENTKVDDIIKKTSKHTKIDIYIKPYDINDIKSKGGLASEISKVLAKSQHWWNTEATK